MSRLRFLQKYIKKIDPQVVTLVLALATILVLLGTRVCVTRVVVRTQSFTTSHSTLAVGRISDCDCQDQVVKTVKEAIIGSGLPWSQTLITQQLNKLTRSYPYPYRSIKLKDNANNKFNTLP